LKRAKRWWLTGSALAIKNDEREVQSIRPQGDTLVANLVGISDRDVALKLKGASISIRRSDFAPNQDNEFYWIDLVGCVATNIEGHCYGPVLEVFDNGAHPTLRFESVMIPFIDQFVKTVDTDQKTMSVDWPLAWLESD
jgi:16S rRNA processing protein RimM